MRQRHWYPVALCVLLAVCIAKGRRDEEDRTLFDRHGIGPNNADVVFLLDRSGSVGAAGFEIEMGFVESFLTYFVVAPNASRVAVISFSDDAMVHADLFKEPGNKCVLTKKLQVVAYTKSKATNTGAGLYKALAVFQNARSTSQKILVLVTDGLATMGPDPVAAANELKRNGVEIHVFGIGRYMRSALEEIATSPDHVSECDGFADFKDIYGSAAKHHWSFQDNPRDCDYMCNSPYRGQPHDPGCCDKEAICACSLTSGGSACLCGPGLYGTGRVGGCRACAKGRYKEGYGNFDTAANCKLCPLHSTTDYVGSTSLEDCKCATGYAGDPSAGIPCARVTCPPLQAPVNGVLLESCNTEYDSVCIIACDDGYELEDPYSDERRCQADGTWSGRTPVCIPLRCDDPEHLDNGYAECVGNGSLGSSCTFHCYDGFRIQGTRHRTCTQEKRWSGKTPRCEPVRCGLPPVVKNAFRAGARAELGYSFNDHYIVKCLIGFQLRGTPLYVCDKYGEWQVQEPPHCEDVTPPKIQCPPDIVIEARPKQNSTQVKWERPKRSDNSGQTPRLAQSPKTLSSPATLLIGTHQIVFQATDTAGLKSSCTLKIEVVDREPPQVVSCPSNIEVNTTDQQQAVYWEEPVFSDNSGQSPYIKQNSKPGALFTHGTHLVRYRAVDKHKNAAECRFTVTVSMSQCPFHPAPLNGALSCDDWMNVQLCQVYCNDNYDFVQTPADWYICDKSLIWKTEPEGYSVPWPDCAVPSSPTEVKKAYKAYYYTGDCRDERVKEAIRFVFVENFRKFDEKNKLCKGPVRCQLNKVKVACGEVRELPNIVRRHRRSLASAGEEYAVAEVDAEVAAVMSEYNVTDTDEFTDAFTSALEDLGEISDSVLEEAHAEKNVFIEMKLLDSSVGDTFVYCGEGKVLHGIQCVMCPIGTFHDKSRDRCAPCPKGHYQDEDGSTSCKACPGNTTTFTLKSTSVDDCKSVCLEGSFSLSGLQTCTSCPRGTYQDRTQQTSCKTCPQGSTTEYIGSSRPQDCKRYCTPGTYSEAGFGPCQPCSKGFYQPYRGQKTCDECRYPLTTSSEGSTSSFECIHLDHCLSDPCENNGTCISGQHTFSCSCPDAFTGQRCHLKNNACDDQPCLNGGNCTNDDGNFLCLCPADYDGDRCENLVDLCLVTTCLNNGTCVSEKGTVYCICAPGSTGEECQTAVDVQVDDVLPVTDGRISLVEPSASSSYFSSQGDVAV